MDKKRGLLNVSVSILFKIVLFAVNVLARRFLIKYVGNEVNGLNSLYASLLDFLSVTELGVGSAITFCMYKPIVEDDKEKISALYGLFKKLYWLIGGIILLGGCALMPFLPYLAKDYQSAGVDLYFTFAVMLVSVVVTYIFSSKTSLINAYKNNYITTIISSLGTLVQSGSQIIVLYLTKSFVWYLVCRLVSVSLQWLATEIIARGKYSEIMKCKHRIDAQRKKEVSKKIKAMLRHKIGWTLVSTADNVIISAFIGIAILGKYTNYTTIMVALTGVLTLFFTPLTSVIGHACVQEDKATAMKYCDLMHCFGFILGIIFFLGYYSVIDNLIALFFGDSLIMGKWVSIIITVNYFIQFMKSAVGLFRDATGVFYYDRWKPLLEGVLNVVLSIAFVYLFKYWRGEEFAVVGVIVATIITNLTVCHVIEPHVVYKYAFNSDAKKYYLRNYFYIVIFVCALAALHFSMVNIDNEWAEFFVNGIISLAYSLGISAILICKNFKTYISDFLRRLKSKKGDNGKSDVYDDSAEGESRIVENSVDSDKT